MQQSSQPPMTCIVEAACRGPGLQLRAIRVSAPLSGGEGGTPREKSEPRHVAVRALSRQARAGGIHFWP